MHAKAISRVMQLAKDLLTGLTLFINPLGNTYGDDPENNNGPITIRFVDVPTDSQLYDDQQIAQEDDENT